MTEEKMARLRAQGLAQEGLRHQEEWARQVAKADIIRRFVAWAVSADVQPEMLEWQTEQYGRWFWASTVRIPILVGWEISSSSWGQKVGVWRPRDGVVDDYVTYTERKYLTPDGQILARTEPEPGRLVVSNLALDTLEDLVVDFIDKSGSTVPFPD